jgi:hypothetical protein
MRCQRLLTAGLLVATLAAGCGRGGKPATSTSARQAVPLAERFGVFARARTPADAIPNSLLPRRIAVELGLDPETARRARLYKGSPVYVASSPRLTCTFSHRNEVGNCWPNQTVLRGLASAASICGLGGKSGQVVVYGLLPDGAERVSVPSPGRRPSTVPVLGNVFIATVSSEPPLPQRFSFVRDGRRVERSTGIPPEVALRGCGGGQASPPARTRESSEPMLRGDEARKGGPGPPAPPGAG